MDERQVAAFHTGELVEVLDEESGVWREGSIVELGETNHLIHYEGWSAKYDEQLSICRIRPKSTAIPLGKRKRHRPHKMEDCLPNLKSNRRPADLVKNDDFYGIANNTEFKATVVVNDPFKQMVRASTNISAELITVAYEEIVNSTSIQHGIPSHKQKQKVLRKISATNTLRKQMKRAQKPINPKVLSPPSVDNFAKRHFVETNEGKNLDEVTQCIVDEEVIGCGDFLTTLDEGVFHFIERLNLKDDGTCKASGYIVRRVGQNLLQCGNFSDKLKNPRQVELRLNSAWQERVKSTRLAAEVRVMNLAKPDSRDIHQRRAVLRRVLNSHIKKSLASKKRQVRFVIPYENRIDAKELGLNAGNMFKEEYFPASFSMLDSLLGGQWDCLKCKDGDKYAYVCRLRFRLLPQSQEIEVVMHLVSNSSTVWRVEYRQDMLQQLISANTML